MWALEDCRHVSGSLERFLLASGERVVRVPPKLMAGARRSARERGKSDAIDALAVARAALREPELAGRTRWTGPEREIRLLLDHREDLVGERTRIQKRLRWHLHELDPELEVAGGGARPARLARPARAPPRPRRADRAGADRRELVRRDRELTRRGDELERELAALVRAQAPALLKLPGCGVLTAAKLVGEIAGVERFAGDAQLAMHAGAAPLPASSGSASVTGSTAPATASSTAPPPDRRHPRPLHPPARAYLARKQAEGKAARSAPLPEAPPRPHRLPHTHRHNRRRRSPQPSRPLSAAGLDIGASRG